MRDSEIDSIMAATIACFQNITKRHLLFHLAFAVIASVAIVLFVLFFSFLANSFLLALTIACFFFVCVMYFVLRLYFQEQKPKAFMALRDEYLAACKQKEQHENAPIEVYRATARAAERAYAALGNKELSLYKIFSKFDFLKSASLRLSKTFHWRDVHTLREYFLLSSIEAYTTVIKSEPTSYDAHAALACAYINLANHYTGALTSTQSRALSLEFKQKFRQSSKLAIEEFNILKEYAPNDPWVHMQLASSYRELKMPEKEIEEYETCVRLCPTDTDKLFLLGTLYFKQGLNAKGLKVYEKLKSLGPKQAETLISYYGERAQ
jgi:Tetratricopeptide repeat